MVITKMKEIRARLMKRKAKALMMPWIQRCADATCGQELLKHISPGAWGDYLRGLEIAKEAMKLEGIDPV